MAVRFPVARDLWLSAYPGEEQHSIGGDRLMKLKGIQEFVLFDADLSAARQRVVSAATLYLHHESGPPLLRGTVSSVGSAWIEGRGSRRRPRGGSSFAQAGPMGGAWAHPGSDLTAVVNGEGGTVWSSSAASAPDSFGWQRLPIDPAVIGERVAGLSHGFALFDDIGSEYRRSGDQITHLPFPNRFFSTREARDGAPFLEVLLGPSDRQPPLPIAELRQVADDDPSPGTARLSWTVPADRGPSGVLGFQARYSMTRPFLWDASTPVPQYLMPALGDRGETATVELRDLALAPGSSIWVGIRAIDAAGNAGDVSVTPVRLGDEPHGIIRPLALPRGQDESTADPLLPRLGDQSIWVADQLDKVDAVSGEVLPAVGPGYRRLNHIWDASRRAVYLEAARNEFVAFQVIMAGETSSQIDSQIEASLRWDEAENPIETTVWRPGYVETGGGVYPDPLIPASTGLPEEWRSGGALLVELYVPDKAEPGLRRGVLSLQREGYSQELKVELGIRRFTLPDRLSFVPQMNAYRLPPGAGTELDLYRLAHRHRTVLNRLPYSWKGEVVEGLAPRLSKRGWDWREYDARIGPLVDGSAFEDLPRAGRPVEALYLPLNENWPARIAEGFRGGYWADDALTESYRRELVAGARAFAEHIRERGWSETTFEFFLNNKLTHKVQRESWAGSAAPWIFDEPVNFQDFWALRWYGRAFREAVGPTGSEIRMAFRIDVSRPQWQRNALDGVVGVYVVGEQFRRYSRLVLDRLERGGAQGYWYGAANRIRDANTGSAAWCLEAWSLGLDGVVPWQTIGVAGAWNHVDDLALLYPVEMGGETLVLPSLRLKAFTRAQQDIEYLNALAQLGRLAPGALRREVWKRLGFEPETGRVPTSEILWRLRTEVGGMLDRHLARGDA